jgi:hypothetical protein
VQPLVTVLLRGPQQFLLLGVIHRSLGHSVRGGSRRNGLLQCSIGGDTGRRRKDRVSGE